MTTTYISLATSATMFPGYGDIRRSPLTPELIKARMEYPGLVVSALPLDHKATIDAIRRRYELELPLSVPGPDGRAPKVALSPGDELFIVQAVLPRLGEGERHSDETVAKAPISFLRWRVPVRVLVRAPHGIPQIVFDRVIDDAFAIALWQRGETTLKDAEKLLSDLDAQVEEIEDGIVDLVDAYLEAGDVLYKSLCHYFITEGRENRLRASLALLSGVMNAKFYERFDLLLALDVMLAKYDRRATGAPKDNAAERDLVAVLFQR